MTATLSSIPTQHDPVTVSLAPVPGRTVVSVWRTGPVEHLVPQLRAGRIRQCTVRVDCSFEELVTAVGLSGHAVTATDPAGVVRAVLAGFDRAGGDEVRATTAATRVVLAGAPALRPERDRHTAVWPTLAHYRRCRATVATVVDAAVTA